MWKSPDFQEIFHFPRGNLHISRTFSPLFPTPAFPIQILFYFIFIFHHPNPSFHSPHFIPEISFQKLFHSRNFSFRNIRAPPWGIFGDGKIWEKKTQKNPQIPAPGELLEGIPAGKSAPGGSPRDFGDRPAGGDSMGFKRRRNRSPPPTPNSCCRFWGVPAPSASSSPPRSDRGELGPPREGSNGSPDP